MTTALRLSVARRSICLLALAAAAILAPSRVAAQDRRPAPYIPLSADQLDQLVAPIALYADPLLAQVLLAATFADQVRDAADWVRAHGTGGIDDQPWDVSVRAVAHYPTVLDMMDQTPDWTVALGQAYANQSTDVMQSVQHLRALAQAEGNLATTAEQDVVASGDNIVIWPAQPDLIYVPIYDPVLVFYRSSYGLVRRRPYVGFSAGFPIGAWMFKRSRGTVVRHNARASTTNAVRQGDTEPAGWAAAAHEAHAANVVYAVHARPTQAEVVTRATSVTPAWSPPASRASSYGGGGGAASSPRYEQPAHVAYASSGAPRSPGSSGSAGTAHGSAGAVPHAGGGGARSKR